MNNVQINRLCNMATAQLCGEDVDPREFFQLIINELDSNQLPTLVAEYSALKQLPVVIDDLLNELDEATLEWLEQNESHLELREIRFALQQAIALDEYGATLPTRVSLKSKPHTRPLRLLRYAAVFAAFAIGGLVGLGHSISGSVAEICSSGHTFGLRLKLAAGASVETKDNKGNSLLHIAVKSGQADCVRLLLSHGATPNVRNSIGQTPLCHLFTLDKAKRLEIGAKLLSVGANPSLGNLAGSTPLTYAAEHGYIDLISLFIEHNCDMGSKDVHGATALHSAALGGQADIVKLLLKNGLYFDLPSTHGHTPLFSAVARRNNIEVIDLLLKAGADLHVVHRWATPLSKAALAGHINNVRKLMDSGAKVSTLNSRIVHPLTNAVQSNNIELVKLLVDKSGNIESLKKDCPGLVTDAVYTRNLELLKYVCDSGFSVDEKVGKRQMTPLIYATLYVNVEAVKLLLAKGANPTIGDKQGYTPLLIACGALDRLPGGVIVEDETWMKGKHKRTRAKSFMDSQTRIQLIDLFIKNGADVAKMHQTQKEPLHFAAHLGCPLVVEHLIKLGASKSAKDKNGRTPLDIARARKFTEVARLLE